MRILPILCLLAVAVLLPPAASAAAPPPLTASFTMTPEAPRADEPVTFTSTSFTPTGGVIATEWDLDNDGAFDDGRKPTVTRAFGTGTHTVRLEARISGPTPRTEIATKTFTIAADAPPTPTPTATATQEPPAAAPSANQPPVARIALGCMKYGKNELCITQYAKVHDQKTFDGTLSSDPDGTIARHEWDLDGDGRYETEGAKPTTTYGDMNPVTVRLRVTDDQGATATTELKLTKLEPECETTAAKKLLAASSPCFRRYHYEAGDGKKLLGFDGKLKSGAGVSGDQYRSSLPVRVNGIEIVPAAGKQVIVNLLDRGEGLKVEVGTPDGTATIRKGGELVTVDSGRIWWTVDGAELEGVELPAVQKLGGLPIVAMPQAPRLVLGAGTTFGFTVRMPAQFGSPTSDKPVAFQVGGLKATAAQASGAFHFEVENAVLGPIALHELVLDYDGAGSWLIKADATLPPPVDGRLKASAGIRHGAFEHAGADLEFNDPGMSIVGPVFLKRIAFRVEFSPKKSECVPHVGVEDRSGPLGGVTYPPSFPQLPPKDYGVPTFALCGEVGLVAGGTILGEPVIGLDGGLGFAMFDDRPAVLRAFGEASLVGLPLYDGEFEMHSDGYIDAEFGARWIWPGVALLHGELDVEMKGTKFNARGRVEACIDEIDWCVASARAVASNAGVAVCLNIGDVWEPGLGYKWGESPTIYFAGCELGPYKTQVDRAMAAQAGARTITLPSGLPGAAIAITGRDGAPNVTLVGPKGERIVTTTTGRVGDALVIKSARERVTQVAFPKPSGGTWTIESADPIERVMSAQGLEPVKVRAKVVGRKLEYTVDERPGQKVTFAERGATASSIIGVARGGKGRIAFDPADGRAEKREIVAIVEQDGLPREQIAVATYRAPKAAKPGAARGVKLARGAKSVRVSWTDRAPAHIVSVKLSDGRRLVQRVDRRSSLVLRGIDRRLRATATVRAVGRNGMVGRAATAR